MANPDSTKPYLEYLEKEMTIMGILSTFSVAVVALALEKVFGAKPGETLLLEHIWTFGQGPWIAASAWMLFAAFYFYRERSRLAWVYGQICLSIARDSGKTGECLDEADDWSTWQYYHAAFAFMGLAFVYYAAGIASALSPRFRDEITNHQVMAFAVAPLAVIAVLAFRWFVFRTHGSSDKPFQDFFRRCRNS